MNAKVILTFLFLLSLGVVAFLFYNNMPKPQLQATAQPAQAPKIEVLSVAPLIAEAIARIHDERSVSELFDRAR